MKSIKEILIEIKKEFEKGIYIGLCSTVIFLEDRGVFTEEDKKLFDDYWINYASKKGGYFYRFNHESLERNMSVSKTKNHLFSYGWFPYVVGVRIEWLDEHIKLN